MKKISLLCFLLLTVCIVRAQVVLPEGMIALFGDDVQLTSTYLAKQDVNRTKEEKPVVVMENRMMFFTASTAAAGDELWVTEGTPETTRMVKDINPGAAGSNPQWLTVVGNKVFFAATLDDTGAELWVSDGTEAGTRMVMDIYPDETGSEPQGLTKFGDRVLFFAMDEMSEFLPIRDPEKPEKWLWISDGTEEGTFMLAETTTRLDNMDGTHGYIVVANGKAMFAGYNYEFNETLWATDGTPEGTAPLLNINTKPATGGVFQTEAAAIDHLVSIDNRLVAFRAQVVAEHGGGRDRGVEMWISDGTTEGTKWLGFEINEGSDGGGPATSDFRQTWPFGDHLYFRAKDGIHGAESWVFYIDKPIVKGENPRLIADLSHNNGVISYNSHPTGYHEYAGYLFLSSNITYDKDGVMWDSSYSSLQRGELSDIFNTIQGTLDWAGREIWPKGSASGQGEEWCNHFVTASDIMFYVQCDDFSNNELWSYDAATDVLRKVLDFPGDGQVHYTRNMRESLYFCSASQKKMYKYILNEIDPPSSTKEIMNTSKISLAQNPVSDMIEIKSSTGIAASSLSDLSGRVVYKGATENTINVSSFSKGIYLLNVTLNDNSTHTTKVVVK